MNRQGGYGEVKFWWKGEDAAKEMELVVRGYVNAATGGPPVLPARRQMAVCTFLHTKGDGIKVRFGKVGAPSKGNVQAARCTVGAKANGWDRISSAP